MIWTAAHRLHHLNIQTLSPPASCPPLHIRFKYPVVPLMHFNALFSLSVFVSKSGEHLTRHRKIPPHLKNQRSLNPSSIISLSPKKTPASQHVAPFSPTPLVRLFLLHYSLLVVVSKNGSYDDMKVFLVLHLKNIGRVVNLFK